MEKATLNCCKFIFVVPLLYYDRRSKKRDTGSPKTPKKREEKIMHKLKQKKGQDADVSKTPGKKPFVYKIFDKIINLTKDKEYGEDWNIKNDKRFM
jgi:hypothetical protein